MNDGGFDKKDQEKQQNEEKEFSGSRNTPFKKKLEAELDGITFSGEARQRVLQGVRKPQSRLRALLEREILIPVKPFAAVLLIAAAGLIYSLTASLTVSSKDIEKSKIIVVEERQGGRQSDGYKN